MSADYIWIVQGEASGLPVYAADTKYQAYRWLTTRRASDRVVPEIVRLFRWGGPRGMIEVCIRCFLNAPNQPVAEKGH